MDPQTIKMIQRLIAEIAGIGVLIWGLVFIYRGIAGKITFVMKGQGFGVKLANASPGVFISLIGAMLMWYSMEGFIVEKKTTTSETSEVNVVDKWLRNSYKLNGNEDYIQIIDSIVGKAPNSHFRPEYIKIHPATTLGEIAKNTYGDNKYWRLIAAINFGKDYFDQKNLSVNTIVKDSSLMEVWRVSKYYGKTTEELIRVKGEDKKQGYDELLQMAQANPNYHPLDHFIELSDMFKAKELSLVQTPANFSGGIETLGELSLKYYSDKTLWPLIVWTNKARLPENLSVDSKIDKSKRIYILHFIP